MPSEDLRATMRHCCGRYERTIPAMIRHDRIKLLMLGDDRSSQRFGFPMILLSIFEIKYYWRCPALVGL